MNSTNGPKTGDATTAPVIGRRRDRSQTPSDDGRPAKASKNAEVEANANSSAAPPSPLIVQVNSPSAYQHGLSDGIQRPRQVASFSYDALRVLHHDDRSRRFYHPPPPYVSLNRGFNRLVERDELVNEHLDSLLASLMRPDQNEAAAQAQQEAHIITWRGMMTRLCTMLYETRDGFEMNLMMVGQTLYIEERKVVKQSEKRDERSRLLGYHGYSFESYTCHTWRTWKYGIDPWDGDVNTNVQWCCVAKTRLGPHRLLIGGEVDAVHQSHEALIEVKTTMRINNERDQERFETKLLRFYMQSFLLGVDTVVVGFRDRSGMLSRYDELDTLRMPRMVRGKPHEWDPMACLSAASDILTSVRSFVDKSTVATFPDGLPSTKEAERSDTYPVFRLKFTPTSSGADRKEISVRQLSADEIQHDVKGGSDSGRVGFLTSEYYEFARQRLSTA